MSSVVEDEALLGGGCRLYQHTMTVSHLRNWKWAMRRTCTGALHAAAALSEVDLRQGTPHENSASSSVHRRGCGGASFSPSERQVCTLVGLSSSLCGIYQ